MILLKIIKYLLFGLFIGFSFKSNIKLLASEQLFSERILQLVNWETKANAASTRSNQLFDLYHYEIPLNILDRDWSSNLDLKILDSLIFTINGEKYVRWIINPEDTVYHLQVKEYLKNKKLSYKPKSFFKAHLTASRSLIVINPDNKASFSLKVSTNKTGGIWTNKKLTWEEALQARIMDEWINMVSAKMKINHFEVMDEPLSFGIWQLDQAMVARSLEKLEANSGYYLPGFSALHSSEGRLIANRNGAKDTALFWNDHFIKPLGKAMAELYFYTGGYYDSAHAQNFLVELDKNLKPTGKIIFRDLGDVFLHYEYIKNTSNSRLLYLFPSADILSGELKTSLGILNGNLPPDWLSSKDFDIYSKSYYQSFEGTLAELSQIPLKEFQRTKIFISPLRYTSKEYKTTSNHWINFFKFANCFSGETKTLDGLDCPEFFKKRKRTSDDCLSMVNHLL